MGLCGSTTSSPAKARAEEDEKAGGGTGGDGKVSFNQTTTALAGTGTTPKSAVKKQPMNKRSGTASRIDARHPTDGMNKFILQFPKIKKSYNNIYELFYPCAADNTKKTTFKALFEQQSIPLGKVVSILGQLGGVVDHAQLATLNGWDLAESNDKPVTFKDLILGLAKVFRAESKKGELAKAMPQSSDEGKAAKCKEVYDGFETVIKMFRTIDIDDSGEITMEEFKSAFGRLGVGVGGEDITNKRMKELDFDGDREITFPEFCVGISMWVGFVDR